MRQSLSKSMLALAAMFVFSLSAQAQVTISGNVFGGGRMASVNGGTKVDVSNGTIEKSVFGANDISGNVAGGTDVTITATSESQHATIRENVFGGANGYYGCNSLDTYKYTSDFTTDDVSVMLDGSTYRNLPTVNATKVTINNKFAVIDGNVYGGGNLAYVGKGTSNDLSTFFAVNENAGSVILDITAGQMKNVFGGGNMASVFGSVNMTINATNAGDLNISAVYGGNDKFGTINSNERPDGAPTKASDNETSIPEKACYVLIQGQPTIGQVYGGGNGDYDYSSLFTEICGDLKVEPIQPASFVDINTTGGHIDMAFAGGNGATVSESATLLFHSDIAAERVGMIFGGNNKVAMNILPTIDLNSGAVATVYGGGNAGPMKCTTGVVSDVAGQDYNDLSTYVLLNSDNVKISNAIYGGCRAADVDSRTLVDLRQGSVPSVFGGNDISGEVKKYADIVLNETTSLKVENIYGAGNGKYDYADNSVYPYGHTSGSPIYTSTSLVSGPTTVDDNVRLIKGTVTADVYGGGLAGDARNTYVTVESGADVQGTIYGAGCGLVENMGLCSADYPHKGNVTGTANLTINGLNQPIDRIFGGGRAGDVNSTNVVVNNSVNNKIAALYGGCMASDLTGTATVKVGEKIGDCHIVIDTVYGGNDFSGLTQNTNLTINNGTFTHVFGAGNGEYDYNTYYKNKYGASHDKCLDTLPYSMIVDVTFNGGYFKESVYGGGNMGLVGDKSITKASHPLAMNEAERYGYINVNVHDGYFKRHIFAGARGSLTNSKYNFGFSKPNYTGGDVSDPRDTLNVKMLAYATKQVNMDGGHVVLSVYGGSEAVDDGFPYECYGALGMTVTNGDTTYSQTTLRPSSIINITGGTVENRVYGAGYRGNIYGSVYVNVGESAVLNSRVWDKSYAGASFADHRSDAAALNRNPIDLRSSIYNGSDWGKAGANEYFVTRGFYGGEGYIYIDGYDYLTTYDGNPLNPPMNLSNSIIGSGTSTSPADIFSSITVKNYGGYICPSPSKQLASIQRTDRLWLENTFFLLSGEQDAYSSYASPSYALCRIDNVIFHNTNMVETTVPSIYIGNVRSEDNNGDLYTNTNLYEIVSSTPCNQADEDSYCNLLYENVLDRNILLLDDGSYIKVSPFVDVNPKDYVDDDGHAYGTIEGYMYLMAPNNTKAYAYARNKDADADINPTDGGFVSPCSGTNNGNKEIEYNNVVDDQRSNQYRSWGVGTEQGSRTRHITIVAHANPNRAVNDNCMEESLVPFESGSTITSGTSYYMSTTEFSEQTADHDITVDGSVAYYYQENGKYKQYPTDATISSGDIYYTSNVLVASSDITNVNASENQYYKKIYSQCEYAYAKASLELPPAEGGSYYTITSVSIDDDNGNQIRLTDHVYDPYRQTPDWFTYSGTSSATSDINTSYTLFKEDPSYTFGLMLSVGNNFDKTIDSYSAFNGRDYVLPQEYVESGIVPPIQPSTVVSGNNFLTSLGGFVSSPIIAGDVATPASGVLPTIDFSLTYRTDITTTVTRDVVFTMMEYDKYGQPVGPIDVTVTISTVISDFADLEAPVLAMYNEGVSNAYVRKVVIPASYVQRELYLDKVEWHPYSDATHTDFANDFHIQNNSSLPVNYTDFSVTVSPSEDITNNISNFLGWYSVDPDARDMDLRTIAGAPDKQSQYEYEFEEPKYIGILDGRAAAAINVSLNYNGNLIYKDHRDPYPLGYATLDFHAINTDDGLTRSDFKLLIKFRTRISGDTIYMAEPDHLFMYSDGYIDTGVYTAHVVPAGGHTVQSSEKFYQYYITRFAPYASGTVIPSGSTYYTRNAVQTVSGSPITADGSQYAPNGQMFSLGSTIEVGTQYYTYNSITATADVTFGPTVQGYYVSSDEHVICHAGDQLEEGSTYYTFSGDEAVVYLDNFNTLGHALNKDNFHKNDPVMYLPTFEQAMDVYEEGDVLCILNPIHINKSDKPISLRGSDYGDVYVSRYTGSHFRWPGEAAAYRGPMVVVEKGGKFTASNVRFNGQGLGRKMNPVTVNIPGDRNDNTASYHNIIDNQEGYTYVNGVYYPWHSTIADTTFVVAPVFWVKDASRLNLSNNVTVVGNYNRSTSRGVVDDVTTSPRVSHIMDRDHVPGGAIFAEKTAHGTPTVVLGSNINISGNLVADNSSCNDGLYNPASNFGAGLYIDDAKLQLSTSSSKFNSLISVSDNYYMPLAEMNQNDPSTYFSFNDVQIQAPGGTITTNRFSLVNTNDLHHSNVYLSRAAAADLASMDHAPVSDYSADGYSTAYDSWWNSYLSSNLPRDGSETDEQYQARVDQFVATLPFPIKGSETWTEFGERNAEYINSPRVLNDTKSSLVSVMSELDENSRVGISKWFPGYKERDTYGRDTISIVTYSTSPQTCQRNANANIFFDDSASIRAYCGMQHEDNVDVRYSSLLSSNKIFFHRCASFEEQNHPILWAVNPSVVCPGDGDTIMYLVKGGSAFYTYNWFSSPDGNSYTPIASVISRSDTGMFVPLTLSLPENVDSKAYHLRVQAIEAGGCTLTHDAQLVVKQVGSDDLEGNPEIASGYSGGKYTKVQDGEDYFQHANLDTYMGYSTSEGDRHQYQPMHAEVSEVKVDGKPESRIVRLYTYYKLNWNTQPVPPAESSYLVVHSEPDNVYELHSGESKLCPGDLIHFSLNSTLMNNHNLEFMMWDFDPTAPGDMDYVVTHPNETVTAYLSPNDYWVRTVTSQPVSGYSVDYHGNVTITNEDGLAWFISTVNGLNGQQARTYIFDTVTIMPKTGGYDMSAHKWTPVGNIRLPFRGVLRMGEGDGSTDIKGIIVNEPELQYIGFFGNTDSAFVTGINLSDSRFKGNAYAGGMVGYAGPNTYIGSGSVANSVMVAAGNAIGGYAGVAENATFDQISTAATMLGNTLYAGGVAGLYSIDQSKIGREYGDPVEGHREHAFVQNAITNISGDVDISKMSALYFGTLAAQIIGDPRTGNTDTGDGGQTGNEPQDPANPAAKSADGYVTINNNYVHVSNTGNSLYVGGLVGAASYVNMNNNYVYGDISSLIGDGALVGNVGVGVNVDNCFYGKDDAKTIVGFGNFQSETNTSTFDGFGNRVYTADSIGGTDNLTRILNNWVRGSESPIYLKWRSDLDSVNHGYPIFGTPDQIPVYDTISEVVCDSINLDGFAITESGIYTTIFSDTVNYIDSVLTIMLTVNHGDVISLTDSVEWGADYYGNGYMISFEQIQEMLAGDPLGDIHMLQRVDSLLTEQGCDSLVVLNLVVYNAPLGIDQAKFEINVYPNPTVGRVNVDADGLEMVEVFDAISRKVKELRAINGHCEFDLSAYASGSYYLRVRTSHGVAVRKVVKK